MFECLPLFFAFYYYGGYWIDRYRKGQESTATWSGAFKSSLFLLNMLYLAVTGNALAVFECGELAPGEYYLKAYPALACYKSEHIISMIIALAAIFLYTVGWPAAMTCIFYIGHRKNWLDEPWFGGLFGFLYKRYEMPYFWWHYLVLLHLFSVALIKVFLFDNFWQPATAISITIVVLGLQIWTNPFLSSVLDRLQIYCLGAEIALLVVGIFLPEFGAVGRDTERAMLIAIFWVVFIVLMAIICDNVRQDVTRWRRRNTIAALSSEHELEINVKQIVITSMYEWLQHPNTGEKEWEVLRQANSIIARLAKSRLPLHLRAPYSNFANESPTFMAWMCFSNAASNTTLRDTIVAFLHTENAKAEMESNPANTVTEDIPETLHGVLSFVYRDIKEQHKLGAFTQQSEKHLVASVFKTSYHGVVLNALLRCTPTEHRTILDALRMVTYCETVNDSYTELKSFSVPPSPALIHEDQSPDDALLLSSGVGALSGECLHSNNPDIAKMLIPELFKRYDLNRSGTIDTLDEASQLTYNVVAKLSSKETTLEMNINDMDKIVAELYETNQPFEMDVAAYTMWFLKHFYGHSSFSPEVVPIDEAETESEEEIEA